MPQHLVIRLPLISLLLNENVRMRCNCILFQKIDQHIENAVYKAHCALDFIIRISACFLCLKPIKVLYSSFVRSHLTSQVWNPQYEISLVMRMSRKKSCDTRAQQSSLDYEYRYRRYHFFPLVCR